MTTADARPDLTFRIHHFNGNVAMRADDILEWLRMNEAMFADQFPEASRAVGLLGDDFRDLWMEESR